ncbi:MAG: hypothetical protein V2A34_15850 [Lentisphaerota bacterium]
MRGGKAAIWFLCSLLMLGTSIARADDGSDLEALLSDIGDAPTATPQPAADAGGAVAPSETAPATEMAPAMEAAPAMDASAPIMPSEQPMVEATPEPMATPAAEPAVEQPSFVPKEEVVAPIETPMPMEESAPAFEQTTVPVEEAAPAEVMEAAEPVMEQAPVEQPAPAEEVSTTDLFEAAPAAEAATEAVETVEPAAETTEAPVAAEAATGVKEGEKAKPATSKQARLEAQQEEIRRQAREVEALTNLENGYRDLSTGSFDTAIKSFDFVIANLPERPATFEQREQAKWGLAEAQYRSALEIYRKHGNISDARSLTEKALKNMPDHKGAASLLKKIAKEETRLGMPVPLIDRPDVMEKWNTVQTLIKEGREYYEIGDYNRAELLFEKVLNDDQYNVDAMRYLKKIDDVRFKISTKERDANVSRMMNDVRDAWNPPVRKEVDLPTTITDRGPVETKTATQRLQDRMAKIMIPSIEFRSANITDVINFLVEASIAGDPDGMGVNIILNLNIPGSENVQSAPAPQQIAAPSDDPWATGFPAEGGGVSAAPMEAGGSTPVRTITLNLRRISLLDAIKYITEVANLKFRMEDNAVIITPANVVSGRVVTRMYPVQPSILDVIIEKEETDASANTGDFVEMGGKRTNIRTGDVKEFFEKAGVPFPAGTSITYNKTISQLIVANTPDYLEIFERILAQLNVVPNQVEIEARFVEVGQDDLEELGLQWILNDNWEIAQNKNSGMGMLGGTERVQVDADPNGFTKGLRFFNFDRTTAALSPASSVTKGVNQSALGGLLSVSSILTNPEVTMILQALSQHGNSDLLSAPRVTTRSGVNAQIQVVKEIIYPTEFEVTQPTVQSQGDLVTPPVVTPGSFETREVGVILNVTPTVGPDGYTIDLTMVPEVAELVEWIQYGSTITVETGVVGARQARTFNFNIPQPVFSSRNVTTSIVIWDGQTVVMGGLIREKLVTVKDKVPFLGDIPLLGRLFRSEGQHSEKQNLLIFVTARLVDPAGRPIHKAEAMAMPGGSTTAAPAAAE